MNSNLTHAHTYFECNFHVSSLKNFFCSRINNNNNFKTWKKQKVDIISEKEKKTMHDMSDHVQWPMIMLYTATTHIIINHWKRRFDVNEKNGI